MIKVTEHPLAQIERGDAITPASLGLSIAEGKAIVAAIQTAMVTAQVQRHGESARRCPHCSRSRRPKGYYTAIFRSVFGKVPMRVRRLRACPCHDTPARQRLGVGVTSRNAAGRSLSSMQSPI